PLGQACVAGRCGKPANPDAGVPGCAVDGDCPAGQRCLPSTGTCFVPATADAGDVDSGFVGTCLPGQSQSCGSSKFGECKLGTAQCELGDAGWNLGACVGAVEPISELCNGKDDDCDGLVDDGLGDTTCGTG